MELHDSHIKILLFYIKYYYGKGNSNLINILLYKQRDMLDTKETLPWNNEA